MHEALILIARAIALAHDRWRTTGGRRRPLSGKIAVLEERVQKLEAKNALLRSRFLRIAGLRRPHSRRHERLEILWHAARYRLSITATADAAQDNVEFRTPRCAPPTYCGPMEESRGAHGRRGTDIATHRSTGVPAPGVSPG